MHPALILKTYLSSMSLACLPCQSHHTVLCNNMKACAENLCGCFLFFYVCKLLVSYTCYDFYCLSSLLKVCAATLSMWLHSSLGVLDSSPHDHHCHTQNCPVQHQYQQLS